MLGRLTLSSRILFSFWAVLILALLVPFFYNRNILKKDIVSETRTWATSQLDTAHWLLSKHESFQDEERFRQWCRDLGKRLGARVTYIAMGGRVVADSWVPDPEIPEMENHATRPEVVQALKEKLGTSIRFSSTLKSDLIYVARPVSPSGPIPPGVIRVALPFSAVKERLDHLNHNILLLIAVAVAATFLVTYLVAKRLGAPTRKMIDAARAIGNGKYDRRIRLFPGEEFYPVADAINRMAESIEAHVITITGQKQQLEAILNGMSEGVMVLDGKGKVEMVNRAMSEMYPLSGEHIGRRPLELVRSPELQEACDRVLAGLPGEGEEPVNLQISPQDGSVMDVNIVRFLDEQGNMGLIVVFHDISDLKRLEKVRRDFVANVSHELRTPLTSIKGYAETLISEIDEESGTMRMFLDVILKNAHNMSNLVDDLLQLARIEAKSEPEKVARVNASSALLSAWKAVSPLSNDKNIGLNNLLPEDGVAVWGDYDQIVQVFRNLLENAVRHSPGNGKVTVSVSRDNRSMAVFEIRDEGPGIPKQAQNRIFERFYRVESDRGEPVKGTGLGLAICRHIIQNHGGRIWVESPPEGETGGSVFFFSLPLFKASDKSNGDDTGITA